MYAPPCAQTEAQCVCVAFGFKTCWGKVPAQKSSPKFSNTKKQLAASGMDKGSMNTEETRTTTVEQNDGLLSAIVRTTYGTSRTLVCLDLNT